MHTSNTINTLPKKKKDPRQNKVTVHYIIPRVDVYCIASDILMKSKKKLVQKKIAKLPYLV